MTITHIIIKIALFAIIYIYIYCYVYNIYIYLYIYYIIIFFNKVTFILQNNLNIIWFSSDLLEDMKNS